MISSMLLNGRQGGVDARACAETVMKFEILLFLSFANVLGESAAVCCRGNYWLQTISLHVEPVGNFQRRG